MQFNKSKNAQGFPKQTNSFLFIEYCQEPSDVSTGGIIGTGDPTKTLVV